MVIGIAHNRTLNSHPLPIQAWLKSVHTVAGDQDEVTAARDFQGKAGVNYTPLGPWIETELPDPDLVGIDVLINGVVKAKSGTFNLPSSVIDCLIYATSWLTLMPGDVVMTGAPGTAVAVEPGHRVDITLGGIGTLTNSVI